MAEGLPDGSGKPTATAKRGEDLQRTAGTDAYLEVPPKAHNLQLAGGSIINFGKAGKVVSFVTHN